MSVEAKTSWRTTQAREGGSFEGAAHGSEVVLAELVGQADPLRGTYQVCVIHWCDSCDGFHGHALTTR